MIYIGSILLCCCIYGGFRILAWSIPYLLSVLRSRGESAEVPEDFDTQPRTSDRDEWDSHTADAVLLTHEKRDDDEDNNTAADFLLWDAEVGERSGVHKYMRRMDRWSR